MISADDDCKHLWHHAATILLARSEHPPEAPKDWRQGGRIRCTCGDCRELQTFVLNPIERTHRFRLRKDRRRHLHEQIQRHGSMSMLLRVMDGPVGELAIVAARMADATGSALKSG